MSQNQQTIPWGFIETTLYLTNFSSTDTVIYETDRVPDGYLGTVKDANVIFTTLGGGVYLRIKSRSGQTTRFTDNFTSTATGINSLVVAGARIQVCIGSAGAGVVDLVWHGELTPIKTGNNLRRNEEHIMQLGDGI